MGRKEHKINLISLFHIDKLTLHVYIGAQYIRVRFFTAERYRNGSF
jgi:hypothetical protein